MSYLIFKSLLAFPNWIKLEKETLIRNKFCFLWICPCRENESPLYAVFEYVNLFFRDCFIFYFWLCWVFVDAHGLFQVAASGATVSWAVHWLLFAMVFLLQGMGSRVHGLQHLWHMDSAAPWYVESSQSRDWTHVPCTGRWILNHWTSREVPEYVSF